MLISKSLFVDYKEFPKLAWWKQNNMPVYKKIRGLENEEQSEQLIELWQKVEDLFWDYFLKKFWLERLDVFEDNEAKNPLDEEDEDMTLIAPDYKTKRDNNLKRTIEAIKSKKPLIYQPWFLVDNLFVRWDYLKLNENWNYDLIEIKAKTHVRKEKTHQKIKNKNYWELENKFMSDISFQKYVINKVLAENWLWEIENFYYAYLNWNYKKIWNIDLNKIIVLDQVDIESKVLLLWENSDKEFTRKDFLLTSLIIEETIKQMRKELILDEDAFNKIHFFSWSKYLEYFWKDRDFWTIYWKGLTSPVAVRKLHFENKTLIDELSQEDQKLFNKSDWSIWSARQYIINYLEAKQKWDLIDSESIKLELDDIKYPICFYDYETLCVPIPFLDNTSPYQQVVVQYSLHKVYKNGDIEHFWWVLVWDWEKNVKQLKIEENTNKVDFESEKVITWSYKDLLDEFVADIWEDFDKTFIVWYKAFENTRNNEIAETFDVLRSKFEMINENTYDLMDIFSKWYYYSLDFKGSSSIKYVLPALVTEMSYDWMWVPNWLVAMNTLNQIFEWKLTWEEKEKQIENLLLYCWQDSLAMYKIYEKIKEQLD